MHKLAEGSLRNRAFTALLTIVIAILGVFSMTSMKQELIPSVEMPMVQVMTISPGATSEQMHDRVSKPIEQNLAALPEVKSTTTTSSSSFSMVMVELEYGTDTARAVAKVELAVSRANAAFPEGSTSETIAGGTSDIPLMYVGISSDGDALATSDSVRNTLIPQLEKIDGVANALLVGAPEQVVKISLDQTKVAELGIPVTAIQEALEKNGLSVPIGSLNDGARTLNVTVGKKLSSVDDLKAIPVVVTMSEQTLPDGTTVPGLSTTYTLSDFADVEVAAAASTGSSLLDGKEAVAMVIYPTADANIVATSDEIRSKVAELEESMGGNTNLQIMFDQAPFISQSVKSLAEEGAIGLLFATLVILFFLFSLRSTIVTAISIPASLLIGFIGMMASGYTLNMLTLAALTLTIGRVVDDSIVVIENIKRHLEYGKEKKDAIVDAVREVASAVTASTLVSVIVYVPIALVSGMVGELFRPFALTVVIAMLGSLFVSLTIVPVLAYWFLKRSKASRLAFRDGKLDEHKAAAEAKEQRTWLHRSYKPAFRLTQLHPIITVIVSVAILVGTFAMVPLLKTNLMGGSGMNSVMISQPTKPGDSLETQTAEALKADAAIREIDGVESVGITIGIGMMGESAISYMVSLDPESDFEKVSKQVTDAVDAVNGDAEITTMDQSMFGSSTVDVQLTAPNADTLEEASNKLVDELSKLSEAEKVESDLQATAPAIQVTVRRSAAAAMGLTENDVVGMISAQMVEPTIGKITIENIDTDVKLSIANPVKTVDQLKNMRVLGTPITEIATIEEVGSIPKITTINGQTTVTVSVTPKSKDNLGAASSQVTDAIEKMDLPTGAVTSMGGAAEQLADSFNKLGLALIAAILLIYVVLVWIFKSLMQPALLLIAIPFAATGSFLALLITNTPLDLSSMIGLLMLTGIVVSNAIVLIDLINQYRVRGDSLTKAIEEGTMHRLRPIIMTALATIAAMVPMALGLSSSTGFISQPLAIVVIGGLISSTLLTLVLLPVLYRFIEGAKERFLARRAAKEKAELDELASETKAAEAGATA